MKVSAIIPTRGDVDLRPIVDTFPDDWEVVVYDSGIGEIRVNGHMVQSKQPNRLGSGRHFALQYASGDLVMTQDDDVIVSEPQAIVDVWIDEAYARKAMLGDGAQVEHVVANLPSEFRLHYPDSAMLGFGAVYHRSLPPAVFARFFAATGLTEDDPLFMRESDRALTVLAPRVLVDIPKQDREFASDENRLWKQPDHVEMRERMLTLARQVRDA